MEEKKTILLDICPNFYSNMPMTILSGLRPFLIL